MQAVRRRPIAAWIAATLYRSASTLSTSTPICSPPSNTSRSGSSSSSGSTSPSNEPRAQIRHKPSTPLPDGPRPLRIACSHLHSNVNLSQIVRAASCSGVTQILACGVGNKLKAEIAREGADHVRLEVRNSLNSSLQAWRAEGFRIVALEQAVSSKSIYDYRFDRNTVLVIGNEKSGLTQDILNLADDILEIPIYGMPYSHNVSAATAIAIYEYCKQYPRG